MPGKDGELPIPTLTAVPPNDNQQNTEQSKFVCHHCKKPGHVTKGCRKRIKRDRYKEMTLRSKPRNRRYLKHTPFVLIANEHILLQKGAGVVPMPLKDLNGLNKTNQQETYKKGET